MSGKQSSVRVIKPVTEDMILFFPRLTRRFIGYDWFVLLLLEIPARTFYEYDAIKFCAIAYQAP